MNYFLLKRKVKKLLSESSAVEMHRCMNGDFVKFGSEKCIDDIDDRINDARIERDCCPGRTDAREHYNGILKVLRRKKRRALKTNLGSEL